MRDEKGEQRIRDALAAHGKCSERSMMGARAFMVDGAMVCTLGPQGLLVRVAAGERDRVLEMPHVAPMKMGKRVMRGFVRVAAPGFRTAAQLEKWLELGLSAALKKRRGPSR